MEKEPSGEETEEDPIEKLERLMHWVPVESKIELRFEGGTIHFQIGEPDER